jgi:CubicO group peptidase (beta-lactamase class C family)
VILGQVVLSALIVPCGLAQTAPISAQLRGKIDAAIRETVVATGVPSASVGIVQDGHIIFTEAYGEARLHPELKATAGMSYPVGSITKQFTSACILLLAEDGKLTLDDPVSRWFPALTRARDVTVRELLSHTSGYEDYAPQDYTIPAWMKPTDPAKLVTEWAGKPLDFEPGTQWQYSNTNFVLAALIVEKASGMPYFDFLKRRVLQPLGINALDLDTQRDRVQPKGYERRALGPLRPAVLEAPGWYFGDGNLAMPVADLLTWDLSIMNQTLLKPQSYAAFESAVKLKDGSSTDYGLGISVEKLAGHRVLEHSGEVGGFVSENIVFPDEKIAVAVLTNQEASSAASQIASAVSRLLLAAPQTTDHPLPEETQMKAILIGLQDGKIDRAMFTADANYYFSSETLGDFTGSLKPLGAVVTVSKERESLRGGMIERLFEAAFAGGTKVSVSTYTMPDGKLEQLLVEAEKD